MLGQVRRRQKNGYALLTMMFLLAVLVVGMAAATQNIQTNGQREKEKEMIWRGKQYVRGIRLYHQKTNRFPSQLEDLYLPKTGIRYMRQAYKDPMNDEDGSWRLIYVGPHGELIGSLNPNKNAFFFGNVATTPATAPNAVPNAAPSAPASSQNASSSFGSFPSFGNITAASSATSAANQQASAVQAADASATPSASTQDPAGTPSDPSSSDNNQVFGRNIVIGVGSKVNKASIIRYEGAKNTRLFEFIWNASDTQRVPAP
jgi:hypothetical protein